MKLLSFSLILFVLLVSGCASTKSSGRSSTPAKKLKGSGPIELSDKATDATYGYTQDNPIKVGGVIDDMGPAMERKFLNQLAGPNGEEVTYKRINSCCNFKTPRGFMGAGLLDVYEVSYEGSSAVELYINMYDYEAPLIPVGFTRK
jgi:hypothetical protein